MTLDLVAYVTQCVIESNPDVPAEELPALISEALNDAGLTTPPAEGD